MLIKLNGTEDNKKKGFDLILLNMHLNNFTIDTFDLDEKGLRLLKEFNINYEVIKDETN